MHCVSTANRRKASGLSHKRATLGQHSRCTSIDDRTSCSPMTHSPISVAPIPIFGPVAASSMSGWSMTNSTSGPPSSPSFEVFNCSITFAMSFSNESRAPNPLPEKCSRIVRPFTVDVLLGTVGLGRGRSCAARPGTAPGGVRRGRTVLGGMADGEDDGVGNLGVAEGA
jgi:hypothetical protein